MTVSQTLHRDKYLFCYSSLPLLEGMGTTTLDLNHQSNNRITHKMYEKNNNYNLKKKIHPLCSQAFFDSNPKYTLFSFFEGLLQTAFYSLTSFLGLKAWDQWTDKWTLIRVNLHRMLISWIFYSTFLVCLFFN